MFFQCPKKKDKPDAKRQEFRFGAVEKCSLIDINNWINVTSNNIS